MPLTPEQWANMAQAANQPGVHYPTPGFKERVSSAADYLRGRTILGRPVLEFVADMAAGFTVKQAVRAGVMFAGASTLGAFGAAVVAGAASGAVFAGGKEWYRQSKENWQQPLPPEAVTKRQQVLERLKDLKPNDWRRLGTVTLRGAVVGAAGGAIGALAADAFNALTSPSAGAPSGEGTISTTATAAPVSTAIAEPTLTPSVEETFIPSPQVETPIASPEEITPTSPVDIPSTTPQSELPATTPFETAVTPLAGISTPPADFVVTPTEALAPTPVAEAVVPPPIETPIPTPEPIVTVTPPSELGTPSDIAQPPVAPTVTITPPQSPIGEDFIIGPGEGAFHAPDATQPSVVPPASTPPAGPVPSLTPPGDLAHPDVGPSVVDTLTENIQNLKDAALEPGDNPWKVATQILKQANPDHAPSNEEIMKVTKIICEKNNIGVPEWGISGGVDHRNIPVGYVLKLDPEVKSIITSVVKGGK